MNLDPSMAGLPPMGPPPVDPAMMGGDPAMMPTSMGVDPSMLGAPPPPDPLGVATTPDGLAAIITNAIEQARAQAHGQVDMMVDEAASQAVMHPAVQAMMAPPPTPMRGMAGGSMPTGAAMPTADPQQPTMGY